MKRIFLSIIVLVLISFICFGSAEKVFVTLLMRSYGFSFSKLQNNEIIFVANKAISVVDSKEKTRINDSVIDGLFVGINELHRPNLLVVDHELVVFSYFRVIPGLDLLIGFSRDPGALRRNQDQLEKLANKNRWKLFEIQHQEQIFAVVVDR